MKRGRVVPIWHLRGIFPVFALHLVMLLLAKPGTSMSFHATASLMLRGIYKQDVSRLTP